jgi:tetraacyldisaccharide 4'-kinase
MWEELARERLERGSVALPARVLGRVWGKLARVERPVAIPRGVDVVAVGGATLGGSGKTPTVLAIARELAATRPVAVVATAYRSRVERARRVFAEDPPQIVGDEAAWLARELHPIGVPVFVGRSRSDALALAASHAGTVIVDGLLQARPRRVRLSLLVVDAARPWGSGRCPPAGDLRAKVADVLAATDRIVAIGAGALDVDLPVLRAENEILGLTGPGPVPSLASLSTLRVGVALALARPERVLAALALRGVHPQKILLLADHARFDHARLARVLAEERLDGWVVSGKCGVKLDGLGVPYWVLDHRIRIEKGAVPGALEAW